MILNARRRHRRDNLDLFERASFFIASSFHYNGATTVIKQNAPFEAEL